MSVGATGVISVAGNLIPRQMSDLVNAALANDLPTARALHLKYYPLLSTLMKLDSNPVPIKAAMALAGHMQGRLRLPMIAMSPQKIEEVRAVMAGLKVI
jgi:4-hydroxy-tetrahydrodipicolinate synthase